MRQLLVGINTILQQIPEVGGATFVLDIYSFIYIYLVQIFFAMSHCVLLDVYCVEVLKMIISIHLSNSNKKFLYHESSQGRKSCQKSLCSQK